MEPLQKPTLRKGGCHCGRVRFELRSSNVKLLNCNCSICTKRGDLHFIASKDEFTLKQGKDDLALYQFGTKTAKHYFCKHCGISSFYVPRSHPDGVSVNARCLDGFELGEFEVQKFDGEHWEENIETI